MSNDKVYIHELINIIGTGRARYMHHMTANWCPTARAERNQHCYGVWGTVGSTGRWPEVVNMWELDGWDGLAANFDHELSHARPAGPVAGRVVGCRRLAAVGGRRPHRRACSLGPSDRRPAGERGRRPGVRPRDHQRCARPRRRAPRSGRGGRSGGGRRARGRAARGVPHRDGRRPRGHPAVVVPRLAELDGVRAGVVGRRGHGGMGRGAAPARGAVAAHVDDRRAPSRRCARAGSPRSRTDVPSTSSESGQAAKARPARSSRSSSDSRSDVAESPPTTAGSISW